MPVFRIRHLRCVCGPGNPSPLNARFSDSAFAVCAALIDAFVGRLRKRYLLHTYVFYMRNTLVLWFCSFATVSFFLGSRVLFLFVFVCPRKQKLLGASAGLQKQAISLCACFEAGGAQKFLAVDLRPAQVRRCRPPFRRPRSPHLRHAMSCV